MRNSHSRLPGFDISPSHKGSGEKPIYSTELDEHGILKVVRTGYQDMQQLINSHLGEVEIHSVLERFSMGLVSNVRDHGLQYGDFTQLPTSMADILNLQHKVEQAFDSLSDELKAKYHNSKNEWLSKAGSLDWLKDIFPEQFPDLSKEVNNNEQE